LGAILSMLPAYPYLKDQIIGPDYQIIQCDQVDSLGSWQDQWCAYHQRRIILSWLLIFVWFTMVFIYLAIALLIGLVILCKRGYRISKL
ncbi:20485_t:CDS:1, partial [Gigaspora rosea]